MAVGVAVAVAVREGGAVAVAGLTKRFFKSHPKRFLNQCLGLAIAIAMVIAIARAVAPATAAAVAMANGYVLVFAWTLRK